MHSSVLPTEVSRMLTNMDTLETSSESAEASVLPFRRPDDERSISQTRSLSQRVYLPIRRVLDFTLALGLTLIALPIVMLAGLAVRLTSRGPAFYTQTRT